MSDNENKKNLADLLEEYFPGAGREAEQVLRDKFGSSTEEETEAVSEEIISLDGDEVDDLEEIPDEPLEVTVEEETEPAAEELSTLSEWSEWADETIAANAAASETFDGAETETAEEDVPEEAEEEVPEETKEEVTETEAEATEETAESSKNEKITEDEDINEKWLVRFAKGIFPVKGDGVFEVVRKIIFLAAVTVFVGAGIMLASTLIQSQKAQELQESVKIVIETTVATYIDDEGNVQTIPPTPEEEEQHRREVHEIFKAINEDYIGYIVIEGCDIYEPVVMGRDVGDEYYLKHDIFGELNKAGTLYMDARCIVTSEYTSPNLVIYGHNQEDGTMFGRLKNYKVDYTKEDYNADFYKNNPVVNFSSEFENGEYLIYAFFVTNALENQDSNGEVFHYHDYIEAMNDEYTFNWYQGEVQKRNQIISPVDVQFGDKLMVLSTCSNEFTNSRFVVFARKLREGETVGDYDFSETRLNPYAKGVDWKAIMSGETSATEVTEQEEEILDEFTTHSKSLNKRNEKTYTTAAPDEEETVTTVPAETTVVTTVPASETSETETETAGSSDSSESDVTEADESETEVQTDENGETVPETDENGETVTYPDSEASESSEAVTSKKKKTTETSETSETVTSKKKSSKSNK